MSLFYLEKYISKDKQFDKNHYIQNHSSKWNNIIKLFRKLFTFYI